MYLDLSDLTFAFLVVFKVVDLVDKVGCKNRQINFLPQLDKKSCFKVVWGNVHPH